MTNKVRHIHRHRIPIAGSSGGRESWHVNSTHASHGSPRQSSNHVSPTLIQKPPNTTTFVHRSWHLSLSLTYLPAWIIVGLTWSFRIFSASNTGLILIVHLLLGLTLASWSFFVAAPFGKSPQLAAVVSTFLGILLAIIALVYKSAGNGAAFIFTIIFPPGFYIFATRAICGYENHQLATNVLKGDPDKHLMLLPLIIAAIVSLFFSPCIRVFY